jgi:hypothetical protein
MPEVRSNGDQSRKRKVGHLSQGIPERVIWGVQTTRCCELAHTSCCPWVHPRVTPSAEAQRIAAKAKTGFPKCPLDNFVEPFRIGLFNEFLDHRSKGAHFNRKGRLLGSEGLPTLTICISIERIAEE